MFLKFISTATVLAGLSGAAWAETITLESDKTVLVSMADRPGTVVVGNPSVADISINGKTIFLHGRAYGNTNMIVLDVNGNQLANFDVTIRQAQADAVSVFTIRPSVMPEGTIRTSFTCTPTCESTLQVGDWANNFDAVAKTIKSKNEIATGSETAEAQAPSAAQ
jgi:Flp pilus assembly secretin CpaC